MVERQTVFGAFPTLHDTTHPFVVEAEEEKEDNNSIIVIDKRRKQDEQDEERMRFDSNVWAHAADAVLTSPHDSVDGSPHQQCTTTTTLTEDDDIIVESYYEETTESDELGLHGVESYEEEVYEEVYEQESVYPDDDHTSGGLSTEDGSSGNEGPLLWRLNPKNSWSDWKIIVTEDDNDDGSVNHSTTYHVHKALLASGPRRSRYFRRLFRTEQVAATNNTDNNNNNSVCELRLPYLSARAFPLFLDLMYDSSIIVDSNNAHITQHAVALYHLAATYQVTDLVQEIQSQFIPRITLEQACPYYTDAVAYHPPVHAFVQHILRVCTADVRRLQPTAALLRAMEPEFLLRIWETERRRRRHCRDSDDQQQALQDISRHLSTLIVGYVAYCEVEELALPHHMLEILTRPTYIPSIDFDVVLEWSRMVVPKIMRWQQQQQQQQHVGDDDAPVDGDPALNIQLRCLESIKENIHKVDLLDKSGNDYRDFLKSLPADIAVDAALELTMLRQQGQLESVEAKYEELCERHAALEEHAKQSDSERVSLRAERDELERTLDRFELVVPGGGGGGRKAASSLLKKVVVTNEVPVGVPPGVHLPKKVEAGGNYHWQVNGRPLFWLSPLSSGKTSSPKLSPSPKSSLLRKNASSNSNALGAAVSDRSVATVQASPNCRRPGAQI